MSLAGRSVTRSFRPLPSRTVISFRAKSTSFTRSRQHSSSRSQGLVLCRSADPSDRGQVGQKTFNLLGPHFFWMTLAVKKDEPDDPANVRFLRSRAVMADTERPSDPFQESRLFVVSTLYARIDPPCGTLLDPMAGLGIFPSSNSRPTCPGLPRLANGPPVRGGERTAPTSESSAKRFLCLYASRRDSGHTTSSVPSAAPVSRRPSSPSLPIRRRNVYQGLVQREGLFKMATRAYREQDF